MDLPVLSHEFLFFLLTTINDKNLIFLMDQFKNTPYESSFRSRVAGMLEVEFPTSIESCVDLLPTIFHSPTVKKIRFDGKHSPLCQKLRCIFVDMNTGNLNELFIENISDCLKLGVVGTRLEKCVFREVEPFLEFELIAPLLTFLDIKISYSTSLPFIVPSLGHLLCLKHLHLSNVIINDTMLRSLPSLHAAVFENCTFDVMPMDVDAFFRRNTHTLKMFIVKWDIYDVSWERVVGQIVNTINKGILISLEMFECPYISYFKNVYNDMYICERVIHLSMLPSLKFVCFDFFECHHFEITKLLAEVRRATTVTVAVRGMEQYDWRSNVEFKWETMMATLQSVLLPRLLHICSNE